MIDISDEAATAALCGMDYIPGREFTLWQKYRNSALAAGEDFQISLVQWHDWWLRQFWRRKINPHVKRQRASLAMVRIDPSKPYTITNVKCVEVDVPPDPPSRRGEHLRRDFGRPHPACKPIVTPEGYFTSTSEACRAAGISRSAGFARINRKTHGWRYASASDVAAASVHPVEAGQMVGGQAAND